MPSSHRKEKLPELIAHLAAEFVERESNRTSLITITGCRVSDDGSYATILFTVLPDSQEKAATDFLERSVNEFKEYVQKKSKIGRTPRFSFRYDLGEKNRQKIDFLSGNQ